MKNCNFLEVIITFLEQICVLLLILISFWLILVLFQGSWSNQEIQVSGSKMAAGWEPDVILTSNDVISLCFADLKGNICGCAIFPLSVVVIRRDKEKQSFSHKNKRKYPTSANGVAGQRKQTQNCKYDNTNCPHGVTWDWEGYLKKKQTTKRLKSTW